jgi:hypothetical protein
MTIGSKMVSLFIAPQLEALETPDKPFRLFIRAPATAPIGAITDAAIAHLERRGIDLVKLLVELDSKSWKKDHTEITITTLPAPGADRS